MLLIVTFLMVLAVGLAALVFFPVLREQWVAGAQAVMAQALNLGRVSRQSWGRAGSEAGRATGLGLRRWGGQVWQQRRVLLASLCLLIALPLVAISIRLSHRIYSFDHTIAQDVDEHVAMLLQGEQLVPPPPLPPALFSTPEVTEWHPLAQQASRQWELLDEAFRQRLLQVFRVMEERYGYRMVLVEGYRSPERQAQLAALGPTVTLAGAGASYHQYGLAADCAFLRNGKVAISERDPWVAEGYTRYGEVAASLGLTWGGGWRSLRDLGHVELRRPGVLRTRGQAPATLSRPS